MPLLLKTSNVAFYFHRRMVARQNGAQSIRTRKTEYSVEMYTGCNFVVNDAKTRSRTEILKGRVDTTYARTHVYTAEI